MVDRYPIEFEVPDNENNIISLTKAAWNHIIESRGIEFNQYWDEIKNTIEHPDYKGISKRYSNTTIYIRENNFKRKFPAKYFLVFVCENLVRSARFDSDLKQIDQIRKCTQ